MPLFARLSGATLAYEITGDGEPLVWCHGLASCMDGDADYIQALSDRFTVLSFDARGHGKSHPIHDESLLSYPHLSRDLYELLEHAGWPRALLAGSSMGAGTIVRVAIEHPRIPVGLFMLRPGSSGGAAPEKLQVLFRLGAAALRSGGVDAAFEFLLTIPEARDAIQDDHLRIEELKREWSRHDPMSIAAALEGIPASAPVTPDLDLGSILVPVLVVPGSDPIHPTQAGEEVAALIPTARALPPFNAGTREEETAMLVETLFRFSKELREEELRELATE